MAKEQAQGHKYGPVLSPMEEDFGSGDAPGGKTIDNGVPGYPKGSARKLDEVTFYEGGNFGKVKNDQGKE